MATYGSYETVREVFSTHGMTVYAARKTGAAAGEAEVAIKVFTPEVELLAHADSGAAGGTDAIEAEFEARSRRRLEVQKKAAASSAHVAPVFEHGAGRQESWYATKFYPRSVNRILVGHVNLGHLGVHHVITAMAKGALDLQRVTGRSHGGIHPTNVQVGKAEKIRDLEVVLSDPVDADPADAARLEKADLRAIGEILYQLVRCRPLEEGSEWLILPIASSTEWTSMFGRQSDAWLRLTNRLLDPASDLNLARLVSELAAIAPKPAVSKPMLAGLAAALLLVVGGAVFGYLRMSKGALTVSVEPPEATVQATFSSGQPAVEGRGRLEARGGKGVRVTLTARYPGLPETSTNVTISGGAVEDVRLVIPHGVITVDAREGGKPLPARLVSTTVTNQTPYRFYVAKDGPAASFTVFLDGFLPRDVKTYGRVGVATNFVVELGRAKADEKPVAVVLQSTPGGAEVVLDDQTNGLPHRQWLVEGKVYTAVARYQDWMPLTNRFTAGSNSAPISFKFPHGIVELQCPTCPDGAASVYVGGRKVGDTPKSVLWPVGETEFTFRRDGYDDASRKIVVKDGDRPSLSVKLNPTVGFVQIQSEPPGAEILDAADKKVGETTPGKPLRLELRPGSYVYKARHKDFGGGGPTNLVVVKGQTLDVLFRFDYSELLLTSDPAGGEFQNPWTSQWMPMQGMGRLVLKPGANRLQARHPKLPGQEVNLELERWKLTEHRVEFPYASLVVTSLPPEATIVIDGTERPVTVGGYRDPIVPLGTNLFTLRYQTNGQTLSGIVRFITTRRGSYTNGFNFIRREVRNALGIELVWLPRTTEGGGFWVGKFEVTREQFRAVSGQDPSQLAAGDTRPGMPVDSISVREAMAFCEELTRRDIAAGKAPTLDGTPVGGKYDLPDEQEWAYYASRATSGNALTSLGLPLTQKRKGPEPVGSVPPDGFGLYDVKGNLWELVRVRATGTNHLQIGGGFGGTTQQSISGQGTFGRKPVSGDSDPNRETGFRVVFRPAVTP